MANMQEVKVIQINDGVYNGTYKIGDNVDFYWLISSESFKKYFDVNCNESDYEGFPDWEEWETFGELKGWTETDLLIEMDNEIVSIPIADINSMWS